MALAAKIDDDLEVAGRRPGARCGALMIYYSDGWMVRLMWPLERMLVQRLHSDVCAADIRRRGAKRLSCA